MKVSCEFMAPVILCLNKKVQNLLNSDLNRIFTSLNQNFKSKHDVKIRILRQRLVNRRG